MPTHHTPGPDELIRPLYELVSAQHRLNRDFDTQRADTEAVDLPRLVERFDGELDTLFFRYARVLGSLGLELGAKPDVQGVAADKFQPTITIVIADADRLLDALRRLDTSPVTIDVQLALSGLLIDVVNACKIDLVTAALRRSTSPKLEMYDSILQEMKRLGITLPGSSLMARFEGVVRDHRAGVTFESEALFLLKSQRPMPSSWHLEHDVERYRSTWETYWSAGRNYVTGGQRLHTLASEFLAFMEQEIDRAATNMDADALDGADYSGHRKVLDEQRDTLATLRASMN